MALQEEFIRSNGAAIQVAGATVIRMDKLPIERGVVTVSFKGGVSGLTCGVALKSARGFIELPGGVRVSLVHIWDEPGLPSVVSHSVDCPDGELRIWNIYRIVHTSNFISEDAWTNNSGMVVEVLSPHRRRYSCSDGIGAFNPADHMFEVEIGVATRLSSLLTG